MRGFWRRLWEAILRIHYGMEFDSQKEFEQIAQVHNQSMGSAGEVSLAQKEDEQGVKVIIPDSVEFFALQNAPGEEDHVTVMDINDFWADLLVKNSGRVAEDHKFVLMKIGETNRFVVGCFEALKILHKNCLHWALRHYGTVSSCGGGRIRVTYFADYKELQIAFVDFGFNASYDLGGVYEEYKNKEMGKAVMQALELHFSNFNNIENIKFSWVS